MMDPKENIDLIVELWECTHTGKHAEVNPQGQTLCKYKHGKLCDYQFKEDQDKNCYCARWNK